MAGIQETKDVLVAANELAILLVGALKDGFQLGHDVGVVIEAVSKNEDFKAKMVAAFEGVKVVPDEVKDLTISEGVELAGVQLAYVPKILEALKK